MTEADIRVLEKNDGKQVEIRCKDSEIMVVTVLFVPESDGDVICDMISPNRPERYRACNAAYSVSFQDIDTVWAE